MGLPVHRREGLLQGDGPEDPSGDLEQVEMAAGTGPVPMDVGEVWIEADTEDDFGTVSAHMQCHRCGGLGHLRCDCPTR